VVSSQKSIDIQGGMDAESKNQQKSHGYQKHIQESLLVFGYPEAPGLVHRLYILKFYNHFTNSVLTPMGTTHATDQR